MNNTMMFYDLIAEKEATEWYPNELLLPTIKSFLGLFKNTPSVLDLGCGTGHETMRLKKLGALVEGLDFSCESIRIARERNPEIVFHLMTYDEIPGRLAKYDGIFASASLIHLNHTDLKKTITAIKKIHNANGYFLVLFQKGEGQRVHYPEINGIKLERIVERYSREEMIEIFKKCNYEFHIEYKIEEDPKDIWMCLVFRNEES